MTDFENNGATADGIEKDNTAVTENTDNVDNGTEAEIIDGTPDTENSDNEKKSGRKSSFESEVFDWVEILALSLSFVLLLFTYVGRLARVDGGSMRETLHHGESLIISDLFYTPERGDIIVFQKPNCAITLEPIVKRVIAKGGETIYIDFENWLVYVYDDSTLTPEQVVATIEPLDEDYIKPMRDAYHENVMMHNDGAVTYPYTVNEGELFCMGDNRNGSTDSRNPGIGPVDERYILGKLILRITPLDKFGAVE